MAYEYEPGGSYRMPTSFGQVSGARNIPPHISVDHKAFPISTRFAVHFRTDAALLERQLPKGLRLLGEPIATLYFLTMKEIQWLGGRGYNALSFSFPVEYENEPGITGHFKPIVWESLADPVISGREDLGYNKLWCDIPDPRQLNGRYDYEASWMGFTFVEGEFHEGETVASVPPVPHQTRAGGTINHKYIPKSGVRGAADLDCLTYWPQFDPVQVDRVNVGTGSFRFNRASWEQLPTMHHIVNALADLPIIEVVQSELIWSRGQGDVSNIRVLG